MELLFDHCDQYIYADGDPDLCSYRVVRCSVECFDSQVLLDPFEEYFHAPTRFVKLCKGQSSYRDKALTSCRFSEYIRIKQGMLPRRSMRVCNFTAALCLGNFVHGNKERNRSIVDESNAYAVWSKDTPNSSLAYNFLAIAIKTCAKSA